MVTLYKDKNNNGKQDKNKPVLSDAVVKSRDTDCTMDNKGQIMLQLATGESIDVPVSTVVSDMEDFMLYFPTSPQGIVPGGSLLFGYVPDEEYGIPITLITMVDYEDTNKNGIKQQMEKQDSFVTLL
eukprot:11360503-Ditylum_brightwellii.AAC.1